MSERYTSGKVGRFDFKTANRLVDAAERIENAAIANASFAKLSARPPIVARLTGQYNALQFDAESEERTLMAWDWEEMAVVDSASPLLTRSIAYKNGLAATQYDNQAKGAAVCIDGQASSGDIVVLHPIANEIVYDVQTAEKWWAFKGSKRLNTSVCLAIMSSQSIGTRRWKYEVIPMRYDFSGNLVQAETYPLGIAYNTYESTPYGHGQAITFTQPSGSLQVSACQGVVLGTLLSLSTPQPVYAFEATNPMVPTCTGI